MPDASDLVATTANPFAASSHELTKERRTSWVKWTTGIICALLATPVLLILFFIYVEAWPALSWSYIWENPVERGIRGGIWPALIGTFFLVFFSLLIVAPVGILAAVYLNEYAKDSWWNRVITMTVTTLAGVPSIVHGLFGFGAFVLAMNFGASLAAAACTIAVMNLPVIITSTRSALGSVPYNFREASWNLGASRWQTIRSIVLPNSLSGILTGIILTVSRAAGETAPILLTGATFYKAVADTGIGKLVPFRLDDQFTALSFHLYIISNQISGMPDEMKYACAAVLITLILVINSIAIGGRTWLRSRQRW